jgi:hypothetical protein
MIKLPVNIVEKHTTTPPLPTTYLLIAKPTCPRHSQNNASRKATTPMASLPSNEVRIFTPRDQHGMVGRREYLWRLQEGETMPTVVAAVRISPTLLPHHQDHQLP